MIWFQPLTFAGNSPVSPLVHPASQSPAACPCLSSDWAAQGSGPQKQVSDQPQLRVVAILHHGAQRTTDLNRPQKVQSGIASCKYALNMLASPPISARVRGRGAAGKGQEPCLYCSRRRATAMPGASPAVPDALLPLLSVLEGPAACPVSLTAARMAAVSVSAAAAAAMPAAEAAVGSSGSDTAAVLAAGAADAELSLAAAAEGAG